jgi:putative transposase
MEGQRRSTIGNSTLNEDPGISASRSCGIAETSSDRALPLLRMGGQFIARQRLHGAAARLAWTGLRFAPLSSKGERRHETLAVRACELKPPCRTSTTRSTTRAVTVTTCGRICFNRQKINLSLVFAGQSVGIKQVSDRIWLVSFMDYDLGHFDHQTCRLEPIDNPFGPKVLPMSPE